MRIHLLLPLLCSLGLSFVRAEESARYPNELATFRFAKMAPWRDPRPLVSTMADVRKALGDPQAAKDLAHYSSYPGDAKAEAPLFIYQFAKGWQVYIYFAGSAYAPSDKVPKALHGRIFTIDLIPGEPLRFPGGLPEVFQREHVVAADAEWDGFSDGTGLCYQVYTSATPYGKTRPGDLNRISYGASAAELARIKEKKPATTTPP